MDQGGHDPRDVPEHGIQGAHVRSPLLPSLTGFSLQFLALSVLEQLVQRRWKILPQDQRDGIKNFIVTLIIKISQTPVTQAQQRTFLNKLDMVLVGILKHEWPHNWPSFIPDLVGSSNVSESLCENNMVILKLLRYDGPLFCDIANCFYNSEEVFEFSAEQMVSQKVKNLKNEMCESFSQVFHLCMLVLGRATQPSLINATLLTLLRFLNWIPLGYIFETDLIPMLVEKVRNFRVLCLLTNSFSFSAVAVPCDGAVPQCYDQVSHRDCERERRRRLH